MPPSTGVQRKSDRPLALIQSLGKTLSMSHASEVGPNTCWDLEAGEHLCIVSPKRVRLILLEDSSLSLGCSPTLPRPPLTGKRPGSWGSIPQISHFWKVSRFKLLTDKLTMLPGFPHDCASMKPVNCSFHFDQSPLGHRRGREGEGSGFQD